MKSNYAFTYVEIMVALLILSIILVASTSAIMTSLHAERTVRWLREARFVTQQLSVSQQLGLDVIARSTSTYEDWVLEENYEGVASNAWSVWTLYPRKRPSLTTYAIFQETM